MLAFDTASPTSDWASCSNSLAWAGLRLDAWLATEASTSLLRLDCRSASCDSAALTLGCSSVYFWRRPTSSTCLLTICERMLATVGLSLML